MGQVPLVSIIMNCYNGATFLEKAIESVVKQTYQNWEIIFWDNCSTDASAEIAKRYRPKLKYFSSKENVPLGEARNMAIAVATGELIAFLDCDDLWLPRRLEAGVEVMADPRWAFSYSSLNEIAIDGSFIRPVPVAHPSGLIFANLLRNFDINVPSLMVRRSKLEQYNLAFDVSFHASEEYNLFMRLAAKEPVATIQETLACWRCHAGSLTGKTISKWADERERTLHKIIDENPGIREQYPDEFKEAFARARYYRARFLVSEGRMAEARREIKKVRDCGSKYEILYWISFLPVAIWNLLHSPTVKRKWLTPMLGLAE